MTDKPNILFITADDMNWDAVGAFGCPVPDTTPNIDRLAAEGIRFEHAHVSIAVCQPSRSSLLTGMYPHRCGGEGFYHLRLPGIPILPEILRTARYSVGILGKFEHSTPYPEFKWDMAFDQPDLGHGRNPALYRQYAAGFVRQAVESDTPFFLMANAGDPHRPFFGNDDPAWYTGNPNSRALPPSRTFEPAEVTTPGFLPDLPDVRLEISEYFNSVRRCDDVVGGLLDVLHETGAAENTIVVFLSDNGMAFPFSKTNCYLQSTRTPWIMRWSGIIKPGSVDTEHFVSGIDLMPTLLDAAGVAPPETMDGFSFVPLLKGKLQEGRDHVFTQFHLTAGKRSYPMRCVQSKRFGYIFNPWSDGKRDFWNESQQGRTMAAMKAAAAKDPSVAGRVNLFVYRVPEELYDFRDDPDALDNLVHDPKYAAELDALRSRLESWMAATGDPALAAFRDRTSRETCEALVQTTTEFLAQTE